MSYGNQTARPTGTLQTPIVPTITNLSIPLAATEVPHVLQNEVQKIEIRARGSSRLQYSFVSGQSGTVFVTIPRGKSEKIEGINYTGTIYIQASEGSEIVEITEWTD